MAPCQILRGRSRLAALVRAKKSEVQTVPRVHEVIRIASELSDVVLGREYQTHIRILLVLIKAEFGARVERHHFAAAVFGCRTAFFDPRDGGLPHTIGVHSGSIRTNAFVDAGRYIRR